MRRLVGGGVFVRAGLFLVLAVSTLVSRAQQTAPAPAAAPASAAKTLAVERIYGGEASLSGRLTKGLAWTPDSKQLSYFETKGAGKGAKTELWAMDVANGQRRLLLSAEKLDPRAHIPRLV